MKTIALTLVIIAGLGIGTSVFAATALKGISAIESRTIGNQTVTKYVDEDTGVACYALTNGTNAAGSISCVQPK